MQFTTDRPYANPEAAARKILEIANATPAPQEGRIHIEKINGPMLYEHKASPAEYGAGGELSIVGGSYSSGPASDFPALASAGIDLALRTLLAFSSRF